MAVKYIRRIVSLDGNSPVDILPGFLFTGEKSAHVFVILCRRGGQMVPLPAGSTVSGEFLNDAGQTVALTGQVVDGAAALTLSPSCYAVKGKFRLTIYHTEGDVTGAIYSGEGKISASGSDVAIDPGTVIASVAALMAQIDAARNSVPAEYTYIQGAIAPQFSPLVPCEQNALYWHDGKLYYALTDHTGAWDAGDFALAPPISQALPAATVEETLSYLGIT